MTKVIKNLEKVVAKRSLSRLMAVQILYQHKFNNEENDNILQVMNNVIDNYLLNEKTEDLTSYREKIDCELLENLLNGVLLVLDKIDKKIAKFLENNHNFNQIPDVMLQILQLGTFELQFMKKNPTKVVINEYVNITNSFFDKKKTDFVNAVLDKISKEQVL